MTSEYEGPVLDNHMHLDRRRGEGIEAVRKFSRSGGTHLCLVNQPSWKLDVEPTEGSDYHEVYDETLEVAMEASGELEGDVYPVLGVHPAVISRLEERYDVGRAEEIMKSGLEVAAEYVENGHAIALKSGRPHYDVSEDVWEASNRVMQYAFQLASEIDCAVQLHTESGTDFTDVAELAREAGLDPDRVVKHYSSPEVTAVVPSVLSREEWIEEAIGKKEFLMETDYLDDPDRPGAVLGLRTVPKRVRKFSQHEEAMWQVHVETPHRIYGVDTRL